MNFIELSFLLCGLVLVFGAEDWERSFYEVLATVDRVLEPQAAHSGTLIFLHGYDETADDWIEIVEDLQESLPWLKIIVPTAAKRKILSTGQPGKGPLQKHSWFDLPDLFGYRGMPDDRHDATGLRMGRAWLRDLITEEIEKTKIPSNRIALVGYDMGGALAIFTALTYGKTLAGVAGVNAYIPLQQRIIDERTKNKKLPVLLLHGEADVIVPFDYAFKDSDAFLKKIDQPFTKHSYQRVKHDWTAQMQKDLKAFLQNVLPGHSESTPLSKAHEDL